MESRSPEGELWHATTHIPNGRPYPSRKKEGLLLAPQNTSIFTGASLAGCLQVGLLVKGQPMRNSQWEALTTLNSSEVAPPNFLSRHPHRHFLLPPAVTELFGTALDWSRLQSMQLAAEKSMEQGKGVHTSLQKCLGLHFCLIRNGLTSCMVDGLYIDDSILPAV